MGDVNLDGELWWRKAPEFLAREPEPHTVANRVGKFRDRAICATCSTVLMARFDTFTAMGSDGVEYVIHGAYVPPSDSTHPFLPFNPADLKTPGSTGATETPAVNLPAPTFGSDRPRPAGLPAGLPRRTKRTPSRSREARKLEMRRARAKERGQPITPDMFMSTRQYIRWRRNHPHEATIEPTKPPKVSRLKFLRPKPQPVVPEEPYAETVPDWDDTEVELSDELAEAEANLARLRASPDPE